ncbi:hypothetical protein HGA13_19470 [Nocardia speluncae]|uniref:Uncharacterized protein n=1 Tax=Nocardia speluncae TaxID=419477 RepID=A0A846XGW9_9NOCA|nr:hypothetical protein [Nocardia speluncae]NKY35232.1 hypothetical protein [Nocardia speluncae]
MFNENAYDLHTSNARLVAAHGGTLSKRWHEIDNNYDAYRYRQASWAHDLAQAVIEGKPESELNQMHALAMAAAIGSQNGTYTGQVGGTAEAMINTHVRERVTAALVQEYNKTSADNFKAVGAHLGLNIQQFRALAEQVDPDTDPAKLVGIPMEQQQAWLQAAEVVADIEAGFNAFRAAAALEGRVLTKNDSLVGLVCPTTGTGADRRKLWDAWDSKGRTGRFGALIKAGIEVNPIGSVREYRSYDRPMSENKIVRGAMGGMQQFLVDSEDDSIVLR